MFIYGNNRYQLILTEKKVKNWYFQMQEYMHLSKSAMKENLKAADLNKEF